MQDAQLGFKNNQLVLKDTKFQIGNSDARISGSIEMREALGKKKNFMTGVLDVKSEYLNINELKKAYLYRLNTNGAVHKKIDTEHLLNIDNLNESLKAFESKTNSLHEVKDQLLKVPGNCDLSIALNANRVDIRNMKMEKLDGRIKLKEEKADIEFSTHTNIGSVNGTLSYKYLNSNRADVYFDSRMNRIHVGRLKDIFPEVNTLFPPLNTMDGILDAQIVSYFPLNAKMEVDLSSLYATCSLEGDNMVLMSNELYHEIAKKVRIKDKERNIIEHIAVDCIAGESKIKVFPFKLDINGCSFLIGGEHNMDMNFAYHVDVLKSFIPIDFGINVKGNLEGFKTQLAKTKFKSLFNKPLNYEDFRMSKKRIMNEMQVKIMKLAGNI